MPVRRKLALLLGPLALLCVFAASAQAESYQRPLIGTFGSVEQPMFNNAESIAIDPTTGDVLVGDGGRVVGGDDSPPAIKRFHPDGTPAPFSALGSNEIDGKAGPGGLPCAEEPASCDKTPQNGIGFSQPGRPTNAQISLDPTTGNIYLTQDGGWVDIFSPEGRHLGQLTAAGTKKFTKPCGVVVDSAGAVYVAQNGTISKFVSSANPPVNADNVANFKVEGYESVCRMALGAGPSAGWIFLTNGGGNAGDWTLKVNGESGELSEFVEGYNKRVAVDPTSGNPIIEVENLNESGGIGKLAEFDGSLESTNTLLSKLIVEVPELAEVEDYATDASGNVYVAYLRTNFSPASIVVYGQPAIVPTVEVDSAEDVTANSATLSGAVNPDGLEVEDCFFEWGLTSPNGFLNWEHTTPCEETVPNDSEPHEVHATISGLEPNGAKYNFRLAARNENGTERSTAESLLTLRTVQTKPATVTGTETATLRGSLRPEGSQYTECVFEWGLTSSFGYEHTEPCQPEADEIPADTGVHKVSLPLSGLQEATTYRFRLKATNGEGMIAGSNLTFDTFGGPRITSIGARDATKTAVSLEAKINPSGFETTYRFEWGTGPAYGNVVFPQTIAAGEKPVRVATVLSGLATGTTYHYRLVAESGKGPVDSGDQIAETLNSCGLPEERCFELVSRRDAGPIAIPGQSGPPIDKYYQASTAPGGLAYVVESGYPDATKGYGVLYRGMRGADGWSSTQLSTPIIAPILGGDSVSGETQWLSNDLSCGFAESKFALTDDPGPRVLYEAGAPSLYRINPDDTYTAVPRFAPEEVVSREYQTVGASQDCGKVVFSTGLRYHGVTVAEGSGGRLYEWEDGKLRNVGLVPGPGGEVPVEAKAGAFNAVSEDGSRVFFTAKRQSSSNSQEIGKQGVFVREAGTTTKDLSLSETSTPNSGAKFQFATADGSKVFFTANAGLTDESSPAGTDLYEYDLETEDLTDLSVDPESGGAQVDGFVAASPDGSHVYFIARGQFLPAYGKTKAENLAADTYSLYGVKDGEVSFVGTVGSGTRELQQLATPGHREWVSSASPDGRYLLFQTAANVTAYDSGGAQEAYLYDAEKGSEGTICISCRPDGKPSITPSIYDVLAAGLTTNNSAHPPQFLTEGKDGPRAFFASYDALAPGAVDGQNNVYEWSHGQVFRLVGSRETQTAEPHGGSFAAFVGADASGSDAYLVTPEKLNWEDPDERRSVYAARIGGGFPEPAPAPEPCDPDAEGSCQGAAMPAPAMAPGAASANFSGPGNVKPKQAKKHKRKHRRQSKKRRRKASGKGAKQRRANHDRRAGK
jgi:Tol biopolymer transport system component